MRPEGEEEEEEKEEEEEEEKREKIFRSHMKEKLVGNGGTLTVTSPVITAVFLFPQTWRPSATPASR